MEACTWSRMGQIIAAYQFSSQPPKDIKPNELVEIQASGFVREDGRLTNPGIEFLGEYLVEHMKNWHGIEAK
jgi:hypothetical protein